MAVTVEPGFYQVPALLKDPGWAGPKAGSHVSWETLDQFRDVRGIRIEDDLLVTDEGHENLNSDIPVDRSELSHIVRGGASLLTD